MTRFLTFRSVSGNLYPLPRSACLICLLKAIVLKKFCQQLPALQQFSETLTGLKKLSIALLPVELTAKEEEHALLCLTQPESGVSNASDLSYLLMILPCKKY